jgi:hypothetical protein
MHPSFSCSETDNSASACLQWKATGQTADRDDESKPTPVRGLPMGSCCKIDHAAQDNHRTMEPTKNIWGSMRLSYITTACPRLVSLATALQLDLERGQRTCETDEALW